ncbi:MAG: hypothetical protein OCD02_17605 [Spirochaetaceae bacterium]
MKIKRLTTKLVFIIILAEVYFLIGCSSSPDIDPNREMFNGAVINNRLTLLGETLMLPEGWAFIQNPSEKGTLFNFRSQEGIEGGLEIIDFKYDIKFSKLVDFYEDFVFHSDKKIKTELIEHERFGTIAIFNGIDDDRILKSLFVADGNNVTFLHFSNNVDTIFTQEEALQILETYKKDERNWVSIRKKVDAPLFTSINNTWFWYDDFKNGYYITKKGKEYKEDIIAGLCTLNPEEVSQLQTNTNFDIEPFIHTLIVQNKLTNFTVYGQINDKSRSKLYTVFKFNEVTYCLYLIQNTIKENENPKILLEKPEIQDLLDYNLLFIGGNNE